jgi:2,3-bisphosphoglycerate-independent phosphoglycerate mutase
MKQALIIGDGMADEPLATLKGLSPLQASRLPHADRLACEGRLGCSRFIPEGFPPGSDVGILGILGYDVRKGLPGRAGLEAAGRGIHLAPGETVFRANFATVAEGRLVDASAGGVRPAEAQALCAALNEGLGEKVLRFVPGVGYRALMISAVEGLSGVACKTPQEVLDAPLAGHWPAGPGADLLRSVMERSHRILDGHEVNVIRRDLGENPANLVWLWGPGESAVLPSFTERTHCKAAVAAAIDLVKGIARLGGMTVLEVKGATGDAKSNLGAKARAALKALEEHDLAIIHVEAPDEASHAGDARAKVALLEKLDAEVIGPVLAAMEQAGGRVALVTDHATSTEKRIHLSGEVPVALWGPGFAPRREGLAYDEVHAADSDLHVEAGHEFLEYFLEHR